MFGFHPVSSFPISDIEDTVVGIAKRDAKIKTWTVPSRTTEWTIPICKAKVAEPLNTWIVPS
tara:strand:+ start:140 stop:325 length:186 start_codon:yes stop_codon:yes gene_type:complete